MSLTLALFVLAGEGSRGESGRGTRRLDRGIRLTQGMRDDPFEVAMTAISFMGNEARGEM
jgi:hypothetical protein